MYKKIHQLFYRLSKWSYPFISDSLFNNLLFFYNCRRLGLPFYWQNLEEPKTFNEKISWIKFNRRNPLAPLVADKLKVKEYVAQKIGLKYTIPTLAIFDNPGAITLDNLPESFILKLNTGSGANLICTQKESINLGQAIDFFSKAVEYNHFFRGREWHYKNIKPMIFAEPLLGENIYDYKFFCFHGEPFLVQVDSDRFLEHRRNFFDVDWQPVFVNIRYPAMSPHQIQKPENLFEMVEVAKTLSKEFEFARIDLYSLKGNVYFGEITLHPGGGVEPFDSPSSDEYVGSFLEPFPYGSKTFT